MTSPARTVEEYLAGLPEDRRAALQTVREVIVRHLPQGYEEGMQYGMIGYYVPHSRYPHGYHCDPKQPLPFVGLGSQKNHMAVYLMGLYTTEQAPWFQDEWAKTGKKLDMGKGCLRFKKVEDVALEVLGESIARIPVATYLESYEAKLPPSARKKRG